MSFDPVCGPDSSSYVYIRSLVSAYSTSLTALCSSLLTTVLSGVNDLAVRVHASCCPVCQYDRLRESYLNKNKREEEEKEETIAVVFDAGTKLYTLMRVEDIDVEKAICRKFPPSLAQSIRVQVGGVKISLAQLGFDDARKKGRSKQSRLLVDRIYIIGTRPRTQATMIANVAYEKEIRGPPSNIPELEANEKPPKPVQPVSQPVQRRCSSTPVSAPPEPPTHKSFNRTNAPVELPAGRASPASTQPVTQRLHCRSSSAPVPRTPLPSAHESSNHTIPPVKAPADRGSPTSTPPVPRPVQRRSSSTPVLGPPPQPQSPNTRRNMPLLILPKDAASEKTISRGSSMRSANIPIVYWPSNQHYDAERENPVPLKALDALP